MSKTELRGESYTGMNWAGSSRNTYVMAADPTFKGALREIRDGTGKGLAHMMMSVLSLVK